LLARHNLLSTVNVAAQQSYYNMTKGPTFVFMITLSNMERF